MTENQPSVVIVKDDDGVTHWTSPNSDLAKKYLKPEEVPDATVDAQQGDDPDSDATISGSRQRRPGSRSGDDASRGSSPAESGSGD